MLVHLPQVTLLGIDCIDGLRLERALVESSRFVRFADIILVTSPKQAKLITRVRCVVREEGGRIDYERDALTLPTELIRTQFVLFNEWDARVANPFAWDDKWLSYDYIGAPWPRHYANGWPLCMEHNCVGNGGFSLRSRRFYEFCKYAVEQMPDDESIVVHDAWACRTIRPWLERSGVKFAPPKEAYRFSCEDQYYSGQFGIHGKSTIRTNGLMLDLSP